MSNPITRARGLSKLARTDYDRKLIQGMIQDGLDDGTIKAVLGYQEGEEPDTQVMPGSFDVEMAEEGEGELPEQDQGPSPSSKPLKEAEGKQKSGKAIEHLVGLLQHLSK